MKNFYEKNCRISSAFADRRCELGVYQASLLMQDAMTEMFEQYKCDAVRLSQSCHAVWAVVRSKLHYFHIPFWMDMVTIKAFPVRISPVTIQINVLVNAPDGTPLLHCKQELCAIDVHDHSIRRLNTTPFPLDMELLPSQVKEPFLRTKIALGPEDEVYSHTIRTMDTDMNGHMNNAAYVRLAMDAFPSSFWDEYEVASFDIHYANESREGETVQVCQKTDGLECISVIQTGDRVLTKARFQFRSRQDAQ